MAVKADARRQNSGAPGAVGRVDSSPDLQSFPAVGANLQARQPCFELGNVQAFAQEPAHAHSDDQSSTCLLWLLHSAKLKAIV